MATIPSITEGMTWAQAFGIINQLIAAVNALNEAVGGALVDGRVDYNSIVNRPKINGVELVGDLTQAQLSISLDSETIKELNSFDSRVGDVENSLAQRVTIDELNNTLQPYAKTADLPDISNLATKTELTQGLNERVSVTNFNTVLTQLNTTIGSKASAGEVPTTVQWNTLLTQMETKVTQAGNSATAAANSATTCRTQCDIATQKAQEAASSAQSVSGAISRIDALENTIDGTGSTQGVVSRVLNLENRVGDAGKKVSISSDLRESRVKTNVILEALKEVSGEVYEKVKNIAELDVDY